jgi:hypothetical protein
MVPANAQAKLVKTLVKFLALLVRAPTEKLEVVLVGSGFVFMALGPNAQTNLLVQIAMILKQQNLKSPQIIALIQELAYHSAD